MLLMKDVLAIKKCQIKSVCLKIIMGNRRNFLQKMQGKSLWFGYLFWPNNVLAVLLKALVPMG